MSTISIESKLPSVGTSIFSVMTQMAIAEGALNLAQGFPDFNCDPRLVDLVHHYMKEGFNQYSPASGQVSLREQIASLVERKYGAVYDPEKEITVTSGATEALFSAIAALVQEGDEVIIFEPAYDSYGPAVELNGGRPVYMSLEYPDFKINWEHLKKRINSKTRLIILNSPHNPSGAVLTRQDIIQLSNIVRGNDIFILSDEVYEHIIFDDAQHQSISRFPELRNRSFVVSSFGKSFHATGWKVGYCLASEELTKEFRKVHQFNVFSTATPFQLAIADFMSKETGWFDDLAGFFQEKRDLFRKLIAGSRFDLLPCRGTYFQSVHYGKISDEGDLEFAEWMTREKKLAAIPVSVFYQDRQDNQVLRFCFAKGEETLKRAAEIIQTL